MAVGPFCKIKFTHPIFYVSKNYNEVPVVAGNKGCGGRSENVSK
jgi:hypothetical protein